jgi:hypothetical protein
MLLVLPRRFTVRGIFFVTLTLIVYNLGCKNILTNILELAYTMVRWVVHARCEHKILHGK